jgi:hypothetical protein
MPWSEGASLYFLWVEGSFFFQVVFDVESGLSLLHLKSDS